MVTDRTAFPTTQKNILISGSNVQSFTVGATAVTAGMIVSVSAAGASWTVIPCIAEAGSQPIGIAMTDVGVGGKVSVACIGCIARGCNAYSDTNIDAGHILVMDDNAIGGCFVVAPDATTTVEQVGILIEDSTAASLGLEAISVTCGATYSHHH